MSACPKCRRRKQYCNSKSPRGLWCTREGGHNGPHVACTAARCEVETWPQWNNETENAPKFTRPQGR